MPRLRWNTIVLIPLIPLITACGGDRLAAGRAPDGGVSDGVDVGGGDGDGDGDGGTSDTPSTPDAGTTAPASCDSLAVLPVEPTTLAGFSGAEDFAFDSEGNLVSNNEGTITKQSKTGASVALTPNIGETAGMRFISNGELIVASVDRGELIRIAQSGTSVTILSGLQYPNGVEVDKEDFVYVSEHNAGQIRRVHPQTGDFTIIATGLMNPNGLSFSPDYNTLYVNSFGEGTVHKIVRGDGNTWEQPILLGSVFAGSCQGENIGDDCGAGTCQSGDNGLTCVSNDPCGGKSAMDLCIDDYLTGVCVDDEGALTCDFTANGAELFAAACSGATAGQSCSVRVAQQDYPGVCGQDDFVGFTCLTTVPGQFDACDGQADGTKCRVVDPSIGVFDGQCKADGFGKICGIDEGGSATGGGLDGLTVDSCGNVYSTEYLTGVVWRFLPDGTRSTAARLPSEWIPNMHWGSGVGGWDENTLYVMDRDQGRLFELVLGTVEKDRVYP